MDESLKGALGVRTADGSIVQLLDFRSRAGKRTLFTTIADGQRRAVFDFYFRGAAESGWAYLDSLSLPDIPAARAGEPDLELEAVLDSRGDLRLKLRDPATGRPKAFQLEGQRLLWLLRQRSPGAQGSSRSRPGQPCASRRRRILLIGLAVCAVLVAGWLLRAFLLLPGKEAADGRAAPAGQTQLASQPMDSQAPAAETAAEPFPAPSTSPSVKADPAASSAARKVPPAPAGKAEYRIVWGDTLWRITERYYGERALYPELARSNALKDPDFIVAGESLVLPSELSDRKRKGSRE